MQVRSRVARREVQQSQLRIHRWRLPDRRAATHPRIAVLRPALVTWLPRRRHCVEDPAQRTGLRIKSPDAPACPHLPAVEADDDHALVVQGRRRDRETVLPALRGNRPDHLARTLVESRKPRVCVADEHFAFADRDTTAGPTQRAAALWIGIAAVRPQDPPAIDVHREHIVRTVCNVQDVAIHQNLGLPGVAGVETRPHAGAPQSLETRDVVAIEQRQRRVPLVVERAAVRDPVRRRQRRELSAIECRRLLYLRSGRRRST